MIYKQFKLEKEVAVIQQIIYQDQLDIWMGNDPEVTTRELSGHLRGMALQLSAYFVKQEPQKIIVAEKIFDLSIEQHLPNSLWDWIKYTYVPRSWIKRGWLRPKLTRFYTCRKEKVTASTDVVIVYPKLRLAFDNEVVVPRCSPINWKYEEGIDG
jgi:hypothetical protein